MNEELAEYLRYMMQLEGWKYVEKAMREKIEYHRDQLLSCPLEEVEKHRTMIEAMKWLPATINEAIEN